MKAAAIVLLSLIGSAAAAAPGLAPARFNPAAPENRQVIPAFSPASVEPVLSTIGARSQRVPGDAGAIALLAIFPNNRRAMLTFGACNDDGSACKSMSIQSFWTPAPNLPRERTVQAVESSTSVMPSPRHW